MRSRTGRYMPASTGLPREFEQEIVELGVGGGHGGEVLIAKREAHGFDAGRQTLRAAGLAGALAANLAA